MRRHPVLLCDVHHRHVKIKSAATPFNPLYKEYFEQREQERIRRKSISNIAHYAGLKIIQPY